VGIALWVFPPPEGVDIRAWHLLAIFVTTIVGIITNPYPMGVGLTWGGWARAAIVPGLVSLTVMPWVLYRVYPPSIRETPDARELARTQLREMGPLKRGQWTMLATFVLLLCLWIFGAPLGLDGTGTTAAFIGL